VGLCHRRRGHGVCLGKTFLWSTTLGLTSEQVAEGGALTLNGVSAVGVLFLGALGSPFIGYQQDQDMHQAP